MILFNTEEIKFTLKNKRLYKQWIATIIRQENLQPSQIDYIFCSDAYLLAINRHYLQHEDYTDIITFDNREGDLISGDIFVSIERVEENAKIFQVPFEEELLRVMSHGIFHLCGYKDKSKKDAQEMRSKENEAIILFRELSVKNNNV